MKWAGPQGPEAGSQQLAGSGGSGELESRELQKGGCGDKRGTGNNERKVRI